MSEFILGYEPDPSGYGMVFADVSAHGFCGHTRYAAAVEEFASFLSGIAACPLPSPVKLVIGEFQDCHAIVVEVAPTDGKGALDVSVQLANRDRRRRVLTDLRTNYSDLESFRRAVVRILEHGGTATLKDDAAA